MFKQFVFIGICFLSILGFMSNTTIAQTLNQNQLAAKIVEGDFAAFKFDDRKKVVAGGKAWGVKMTKASQKDGSGATIINELVLNRAGIMEEFFKPDLANHPAYFFNESVRVMIFEGKIFYYAWKSATAEIKYILAPSGESVSGTHDDWKKKIELAQSQVLAEQKNARTAIASEKEAKEAAEKLANSIKGKAVKALRVKFLETGATIGHLTKVKYGIEAELTDGKVLKTSTMGGKLPWDDFDITVEGAEFGEELLTVWLDCEKIPSDKIIVNVKAKHGINSSTTASLDLPFTQSVILDYSGNQGGQVNLYSYAGYRGHNGKNLHIKAKADKTASGKNIIKVEVTDGVSGEILNRLKVAPGTTISVFAGGGNGSQGGDNTAGGNGGDGGNVNLVQDPNVVGLAITVQNKGGSGGKHKDYASKNGAQGNNGRYENQKQAVSFSW